MKQVFESEVVIIGAGAAGLRAASVLSRAGVRCTVLEARSRVGGRLRKVELSNEMQIDLGASFIHFLPSAECAKAHKTHPILAVMDELGFDLNEQMLEPAKRARQLQPGTTLIYDAATGKLVPRKQFDDGRRAIQRILNDARDAMEEMSGRKEECVGLTALDLVHEKYVELLQCCSSPLARRLVDYCVARFECYEGVLSDIGAQGYGHDTLEGSDIHAFNRLTAVIEAIKEQLCDAANCQFRFRRRVTRIKHAIERVDASHKRERNNVVTATALIDGRKVEERYYCKHVICAVPVFCLQNDDICFEPPLHRSSIVERCIGGFNSGVLNVVVIEFENHFPLLKLTPSGGGTVLDTLAVICNQPKYSAAKSSRLIPGRFQKWGPIHRVLPSASPMTAERLLRAANVWKAFLMPGFIKRDMDSQSDAQIVEELRALLQKALEASGCVFSGETVPKVKRSLVTHWHCDPLARGGWALWGPNSAFASSSQTMASSRVDWSSGQPLAAGMRQTLLFAGEYTEAESIGTLGAALVSGLNAANHVLREVRAVCGSPKKAKSATEAEWLTYQSDNQTASAQNFFVDFVSLKSKL